MTDDQITRTARDLSEIIRLQADLEAQAENKSSDRLMPGGEAMVALGPVANPEAWANIIDTRERLELDTSHVAFEDEDGQPPLQTLLFWSQQLRVEQGQDYGQRPTITSEASYLKFALEHLWATEPHFDDFAEDIKMARRKLENMLYAGERVELGAPCLYPECRGARLFRKIDQRGERSNWRCRKCQREWDESAYARMVTAAHEASKFEDIDGVTWCSDEYAARKVERPVKTIRTWRDRDKSLDVLCLLVGRRVKFIRLDQVRELDAEKKRRRRSAA